MRLERVQIAQFRRFRAPVELVGLSAGLNVLAGPNESGKSTLVQAIRVAFFERYKTTTLRSLQPWDDSGAAPAVTLEFVHAGRRWRLAKRFLKQPRCDLWIDNERLTGDEAEARIAEVFGFRYAGRGASEASHWGVPGLMWIEQGQGQVLREAVSHAGSQLRDALGEVVDDVAGGGGEAVIDAVQAQLDALQTATGRPRGERAKALEALARHREQHAELQARAQLYAERVDQLAQSRRRRDAAVREAAWRTFERQADTARARLDAVRELQREQSFDEQRRAQLVATQREAVAVLDASRDQRRELATLAQRLQAEDAALAQSVQRYAVAEREGDQARDALGIAQGRVRRARARKERRAAAARVAELERQSAELAQALDQARAMVAERDVLRRAQIDDALPSDVDACLERLRAATQAAAECRLRCEAAATRLTFELEPGQSLTLVSGDASDTNADPQADVLTGSGTRRLAAVATLAIPNVGRLRIEPGGAEVAALRLAAERAEAERIAAARALGVSDLAEAEARVFAARERERAIAHLDQRLAAYAPQGVAALEERLSAVQAALAGARQSHAVDDDEGVDDCAGDEDAALAEAERALVEAQARLDARVSTLQSLREAQVAAQARRDSLRESYARLERRLAEPEQAKREHEAQARLAMVTRELATIDARRAERQVEIDAVDSEALSLDVERLSASADEARQALRRLELECVALEAELRAQDAEGLDEAVAAEAAAIAGLETRVAQFKRRARALELLRDRLVAARSRAHERLQAPLQARLNHYLRLVFPGASVALDDMLCPAMIDRGGDAAADVAALSFGTREQIGLLGRLAYADVLRDAGRPTLLILDDALVHSDPERMQRIKAPLFDAARRHQILVFTCHPEAWRDAGVPIRDLETTLAGSAAP